jgi:3-oxoacyl-(acyl-carrier-protein) synthase
MKITIAASAFIEPDADFDLKTYLASPKTYLDRASALALAGCALALRNAGLEGPFDADFGIALGTRYGAVETMRMFEATLAEKGAKSVSPLLFSHSYFNSPISLCAIEWGLKGWHGTFCGQNALREAAIAARDAIFLGHATRMICGSVEANSPARALSGEANPHEWSAFWLLEQGGAGRNFDEALSAGEFEGDTRK